MHSIARSNGCNNGTPDRATLRSRHQPVSASGLSHSPALWLFANLNVDRIRVFVLMVERLESGGNALLTQGSY